MESPYIEAQKTINEAFGPFWFNIEDWLPDIDYRGWLDYDPKFYKYGEDVDADDVRYMQKEYHKMANIILGTIMHQHNAYEIGVGLNNIDASVKEALETGNFTKVLDPCYQLFCLFQQIRRSLYILMKRKEA